GVERWLAVTWGVGAFTQVACSVATIFAGIYAAALRKSFFNRHAPNMAFALATGAVAEVLHMMLVFITHPNEPVRAFEVTQTCALPMITCVAVSVMLCSLVAHLLDHQPLVTPATKRNIGRTLHNRMLIAVVAAFFVTIGFTVLLQTNLARAETESLLKLNIEDVERDIIDASDSNLLALTRRAAETLGSANEATDEECARLADELDVAEINAIGPDGIIIATSEPAFLGFDMASGEQSAAFLPLLPSGGEKELVQSYQPISYDAGTSMKYAGVAVVDGLVQVGYDAENFLDDLSAQVEAAVRNRHVGQSGVLVVIDEAGDVVSTRGDIANQTAEQLASDASTADIGQVFVTSFADEECFASYQEVEGYRIIALLPLTEANASRDRSALIMAFMEVLVFAALFLVIYGVVKLVVVRGVRKMNRQLGQITDGDLNVVVDVRTASEFSSLSDRINQTVGVLKESLATVKADLDMAADLQANTLPDITTALAERSEFDLYATMEPAKEVGGDFYDFFLIDDDHLALVVADVSGKGVSAALFMMQSKTVIKMEALTGASPAEVLERANADLSEKNDGDMFTTAWIGILEISTGMLTYADAGHEKLALFRGGTWKLPKKSNGAIALASFDEADYAELPEKYRFRNCTVALAPGDAIFQYTDGVTEATDAQDELFGERRLLESLNDAPAAEPSIVLPFIREQIGKFVNGAAQFDDITMLGLEYKGLTS
ncbi:MAG: SpoIIE family protein phosphatase, partial [Eggerthellaceae bacterium]|nr:SpoIIE family protein phosphatase [Eggerthellaceae bacterium]